MIALTYITHTQSANQKLWHLNLFVKRNKGRENWVFFRILQKIALYQGTRTIWFNLQIVLYMGP